MLQNIKDDLHKELAAKTKEADAAKTVVQQVLTEDEALRIEERRKIEISLNRKRYREHFKSRLRWIKEKQQTMEDQRVPDEIDGIVMKKRTLDDSFTPNVCVYGGVNLSNDEMEALKLPPKYTVYQKPDQLQFKAGLEKTFNSLRWGRQIGEREEQEGGNEQIAGADTSSARFYNEEEQSYDGKNMTIADQPFNKGVCIPEYADPGTEAKMTL